MSETGTCLLLEGEKVREVLQDAWRASRRKVAILDQVDADTAMALVLQGDPVALMLGYTANMATAKLLYSILFGEEIEGAVADNG